MRCIAAILLALVLGGAYSQSPTPRGGQADEPPRAQTKSPNQRVAIDERGTEKVPVVVKVLPTPKTVAEAAQEAADRLAKATADSWMLAFTGILAVFTVVLAVSTIALWRVTKKSADAVKQAADVARDEFLSTHRPKLIVRRIATKEIKGAHDTLGVDFVIANIGDTAAKIIEISTKLWHEQSGEVLEDFPARPPYGASTSVSITIQSGESYMYTHAGEEILLSLVPFEEGYTKVSVPKGRATSGSDFLFLGYIVYEDGLRKKRRTAFCRRYDFGTKRFTPIDDPDYEYQD